MTSLKNLRKLAEQQNIKHIYPGHGPVIMNKAIDKIDEYLSHRNHREEQILAALRTIHDSRESFGGWISSWELVSRVYGDGLPLIIMISALGNLNHHLHKLHREGQVDSKAPALWRFKDADRK
jgi:endoribonuclease LACTB2